MTRLFVYLIVTTVMNGTAASASAPARTLSAAPSRSFFNPTLGEKVAFEVKAPEAGRLRATVIDRDGFAIRALAKGRKIARGSVTLAWDGRSDAGQVVPNEAYTVRIEIDRKGSRLDYFPSNNAPEVFASHIDYYDRLGGSIVYHLPRPSRVHLTAGVIEPDPATARPVGPIYRTLVNEEPRPAGAVNEPWNGYDSDGIVHFAAKKGFVTWMMTSALPESAVITTGNRTISFAQYASKRTGETLHTWVAADHADHKGLTSLQDTSPAMHLKAATGTNPLRVESDALDIDGSLEGASAEGFATLPARFAVFVDQTRVQNGPKPDRQFHLTVPLKDVAAGEHVVTVNWITEYGPAAMSSMRIVVTRQSPIAASERK